MLVVQLALLLGDTTRATAALRAALPMMDHQLLPGGQQPYETLRADSLAYYVQNLRAWISLAMLGGS